MAKPIPVIALTAGEPAGIGPELCASITRESFPAHLVVIADRSLIAARTASSGEPSALADYSAARARLPLAAHAHPGRLDPSNARYVLATLDAAIDGCIAKRFDAMVTAPVHKGIINDAGIAFTGHTEYLAARTATPHAVMLLVGGGMRVALATTHLPLAQVPAAITRDGLMRTLRIVHDDLQRRFGIAAPRIAVTGLNPHAGESGHLGREEIDIIAPAIAAAQRAGIAATGPLAADTLFTPARLATVDCVLAMYHDQGLAPLKYASFGEGVNVTLGLPIVRTSVDHGTALDLAGSGTADAGSLRAAIRLAIELAGDA